jgi:hypothetical protein
VVPWRDLSTANEKYLSDDSLPEGISLRDPSKLQLSQVVQLWSHWRKMYQKNESGLLFIHGNPKDMREGDRNGNRKQKGKDKVPFMDPGTPSRTTTPTPSEIDPPLEVDQDGAGPSGHPHSPVIFEEAGQSVAQTGPETAATPNPSHGTAPAPDGDGTPPSPSSDDQENVTPDINSPKHHCSTKRGRLLFLKSLSDEDVYLKMLKSMERIPVSHTCLHSTTEMTWSTFIGQLGSQSNRELLPRLGYMAFLRTVFT